MGDEHQGLLAYPFDLEPEEDDLGPVEERHGESASEDEPEDREPPRLEGGILVAQRPDADVRQVLTEPGRPMAAGCPPVIRRVAIEAVDEDHIPASLGIIAAVNPDKFGHETLSRGTPLVTRMRIKTLPESMS